MQCRPSPSPVPECSPECKCANEPSIEHHNATQVNRCPIHIKLRENCCIGRSLQQMLEVTNSTNSVNKCKLNNFFKDWHTNTDEDEDEESYIPLEEVQAFRRQQQLYNEQRRQLRNDLRLKFDRLCGRVQSETN